MSQKQKKKKGDTLLGFINLGRHRIFKSVELAVILQSMNTFSLCLEMDNPSL